MVVDLFRAALEDDAWYFEVGCPKCGYLYSSDCKRCNRPLDHKLLKDLLKNIKHFWKNAGWIVGHHALPNKKTNKQRKP